MTVESFTKHRWVAISAMGGLLLLLVLTLWNWGDEVPERPVVKERRSEPWPAVSVEGVQKLFSVDAVTPALSLVHGPSPFYTTYFQPPPAPKPADPAPPTTRQVELVYQGFYEMSMSQRKAFLKMDGRSQVTSIGTPVAGGFAVHAIDFGTLTLTNAAGETNVLLFNEPKTLEIPVQ